MKPTFTLMLIWTVSLSAAQNEYTIPEPAFPMHAIEKHELQTLDNEALKQAEMDSRKPGRPDHFAVARACEVNCHQMGTWEFFKNDSAIWRIYIRSPGAYSLNFGFTLFDLPPSASLNIFSPDREQSLGPFIGTDKDGHSELWTPILEGDAAVFELSLMADEIDLVKLSLGKLNHDFLNYKSGGVSGACNLDVVCGANNGWPEVEMYRNVINSVGGYTLNGIAQCTGVLVNNTRNDCTPYFLTAQHCEITKSNAHTVVIYWNYQNRSCRAPNSQSSGQPGNGSKNQFSSGASLVASYPVSDFALILLDDPVPEGFNPYFAGWDRTNSLPSESACVHHPGVEEKRISIDLDTARYETVGGIDTAFIRVLDWDVGTTEGGSSGAPLFNQDMLMVGTLTGGQASCSNDLWDSFGWIRRSWEGGGTPDTRLKDWLDPEGTGMQRMEGKNCSFIIGLGESKIEYCVDELDQIEMEVFVGHSFIDTVELTVENAPPNLTIQFEDARIPAGDTTKVTLTNLQSLSEGPFVLQFHAENQLGDSYISFVVNPTTVMPNPPGLYSPSLDETLVSTNILFEWESNALNYDIQVATDPFFLDLVAEGSEITENYILYSQLNSNRMYWWRVRGRNLCGEGAWSLSKPFEIGYIHCDRFVPFDLPLEITTTFDDTIISTIDFPFQGIISDVKISNIQGTHTWISDLSFIVESPKGTQVKLLENECYDEDDFFLTFDDVTGTDIFSCPFTDGRSYKSIDPLTNFRGEDPRGTWKLIVIDGFSQDGGSLENWQLDVCLDLTDSPSAILSENEIIVCENDRTDVLFFTGTGFGSTLKIETIDTTGQLDIEIGNEFQEPGDTTILSISNLASLNPGRYGLLVKVTGEMSSDSLILSIIRVGGPGNIVLKTPNEGKYDIDSIPVFSWTSSENAETYRLEIATDSLFQDIEFTTVTNQILQNLQGLLIPGTTYFWRVVSINDCGTTLSMASKFSTKIRTTVLDLDGHSFNIYPNPFRESIFLKFDGPSTDQLSVYLYNITGRLVHFSDVPNQSTDYQFDVSGLLPGLYILKIRSSSGLYISEKLIKH